MQRTPQTGALHTKMRKLRPRTGADESSPEERSFAATTAAATPMPAMIGIRFTTGVFLATL